MEMITLVPLVTVGVARDGQTVHPKVGETFDFTVDEKADLDRLSGQTKVEYYREPVNETPVTKEATSTKGTTKATGTKAAGKTAGNDDL